MWLHEWGSMIWGGAVAVPTMSPVALVFLMVAMLAAGIATWRRTASKSKGVLLSMAILIVTLVAIGQVSMPTTFVNGTVEDADAVNENFEALLDETARYHLSIVNTAAGPSSSSLSIPVAVTNQLCADEDGCRVLIVITNLSVDPPGSRAPVPSGLRELYINTELDPFNPGGVKYFINNNQLVDGGNTSPASLLVVDTCAFSDFERVAGATQPDDSLGFFLWWGTSGWTPTARCTLTIMD